MSVRFVGKTHIAEEGKERFAVLFEDRTPTDDLADDTTLEALARRRREGTIHLCKFMEHRFRSAHKNRKEIVVQRVGHVGF